MEHSLGEFSNQDLLMKINCEGADCDNIQKEHLWDKYIKGEFNVR